MYAGKLAAETAGIFLYFPLWWYSAGLRNFLLGLAGFWINRARGLAILVWIKNIHKPMYGQSDWQGRLISFLMRLVQIIARGLMMVFWSGVILVLLFGWIFLPLLVFYHLLFQLGLIEIDFSSLF
jgi:hypothetical protein